MASIDAAQIEGLIPHTGCMCLLAEVTECDAENIHVRAESDRTVDHALRRDERLATINAVEYAAQAMAVHGALRAGDGVARAGYLAAVRGLRETRARGAAAVLTRDADGQHPPEAIPRLLSVHAAAPQTLVLGARSEKRRTAPAYRRLSNDLADFWISWAAGRGWIPRAACASTRGTTVKRSTSIATAGFRTWVSAFARG